MQRSSFLSSFYNSIQLRVHLVCKTPIIRVSSTVLVRVRWRHVVGVGVLVDSCAAVFFQEGFLHFPVVLLRTDGEFEIFAGDGVPVL
jgi:hypothetical protein